MPNTMPRTLSTKTLKGIPGHVITWRNMEGQVSPYNRNGDRYFAIKLDDDFAHELEDEGWPIIWREEQREGEETTVRPYFKITIKYGTPFPVDIYLINKDGKTKTPLSEEEIRLRQIDNQPIEFVDVVIRPYYWSYMNDQGVKAQLRAMNIKLQDDGFDDEYDIVY